MVLARFFQKVSLITQGDRGSFGNLIVYPWVSVPQGSTVCDVGGGNGHVMLELLRSHPHLKVIVQDLESALADGKKARPYFR